MADPRTDDRSPPLVERGKRLPGKRAPSGPASESHEIDEPRNEGPVESLGRSIGEVVLGSDEEDREADERTGR